MAAYSIIINDPLVRKVVQENALARVFKQPLLAPTHFRMLATPIKFTLEMGESRLYTRRGSPEVEYDSMTPGSDPDTITYGLEQWIVVPKPYGKSRDLHVPSNAVAMANKLLEEYKVLGEHAARTLSKLCRAKIYNAAYSGRTVTSSAVSASTTVPVKHLNGFTRARKADGTGVRYDGVSSTNKLKVYVYDTGSAAFVERNVTGYTATRTDEWAEVGPGSLTLDSAVTVSAANYEVVAYNAQWVVRSGIGCGLYFDDDPQGVHSISKGTQAKVADIRAAVARLRDTNVPPMDNGMYILMADATSLSQLRNDPEGQNLFSKINLNEHYLKGTVDELEGCIVVRASECPNNYSVGTADSGRLALEVTTADGAKLHHMVIVGKDFLEEHYIDSSELMSRAGQVPGIHRYGEFAQTDNGEITLITDRVKMVTRPALDKLGETFSVAWSFKGDFVCGSDGVDENSGGDPARFKRGIAITHAE